MNSRLVKLVTALTWGVSAALVAADPVGIDPANTQNGITEIFSATFDGSIIPNGDPFFGGTPPPDRAITLIPNPTGVTTGVPGGTRTGSAGRKTAGCRQAAAFGGRTA